ncbi:hypothetical protein ACTMTJ_09965 [Phytohabitans sp. LJ34]|uniref:hypothetical protein n=1 Tax=Phytohabitans sp. LJ34 TaxID=3452217 RepID=UPI003F8B6361
MNLDAVTQANVLAAIAQCDDLGRRAFLKAAHFGTSYAYFLDHEDKLYDVGAIMSVAHERSEGQPLTRADLKGAEAAVARLLQKLGFRVVSLPRPDWTREEILLACELVVQNGGRQLGADEARVKELSALLQSSAIHPGRKHPDFRNPAGVARKTLNIVDPRSNGNRLDHEVFEDFQARPVEMHAEAAQIRLRLLGEASRDDRKAEGTAGPGFDRSYRGKPAEGLYPSMQATSPEAKEAALMEHDALCRRLIDYLNGRGILAGELVDPPVDIAWQSPAGFQMIAEVKSCSGGNDINQLRLGLGQVIEYRHRVTAQRCPATAVLVVSRVTDPTWFQVCRSVDVHLLAGDDEAGWSRLVTMG